MATTPRDLLLYELGIARDSERTGRIMVGRIRDLIRNEDLIETLRCIEEQSERHLSHVSMCLQTLGGAPLETPSETVNGISGRFEAFTRLQPTCELLELFALSTVRLFLGFGISTAKSVLKLALLMGETQCAEGVRETLAQKEETLRNLEQVEDELTQRSVRSVPAVL